MDLCYQCNNWFLKSLQNLTVIPTDCKTHCASGPAGMHAVQVDVWGDLFGRSVRLKDNHCCGCVCLCMSWGGEEGVGVR